MACRGVHFALTPKEAARLASAAGDDEALMEVIEEIEERWDDDWTVESDKAWDAIHRCLTDGKMSYGDTPRHRCILGAGSLHEEDDYIVNLVEPAQVKAVAAAIRGVDESSLRQSYFALDPDEYDSELTEEDFGYTWENFVAVRELFEKAAKRGRAVVFTVDQ